MHSRRSLSRLRGALSTRLAFQVGTVLLASCFGAQLRAQGPEAHYQAFVDPSNGGTGTVITRANVPALPSPFYTVQAAIDAIVTESQRPGNPPLSATTTGMVHVHQGVVSKPSNGEVLPIRMKNYISVQGQGADKVTVVGYQDQLYMGPKQDGVFDPVKPVGTRRAQEVLFDFSGLQTKDYDESISQLTLRGGEIQVYMETEERATACINNVVFDMLHRPEDPGSQLGRINGPSFGVMCVSVYNRTKSEYTSSTIKYINNTVIMGWRGGAGLTFCRNGAVGFCDVNDMLSGPGQDPIRVQRGVAEHLLINSIFRTLPEQQSLASRAMLGIDRDDAYVDIGTQRQERNAFDVKLASTETGPNGDLPVYLSNMDGSSAVLPLPCIDVNRNNGKGTSGRDSTSPGLVGEYINKEYVTEDSLAYLRDWRLLPSSPYIDLGTAPDKIQRKVQVANGESYVSPNDESDAFDWDGEGYGNKRIASPPQAPDTQDAEPDLGYDEASNLISTACRANDSASIRRSSLHGRYPKKIGTGASRRILIVPHSGSGNYLKLWANAVMIRQYNGVILPPPWENWVESRWPTLDTPTMNGTYLGYQHEYMNMLQGMPIHDPALPNGLPAGLGTFNDDGTLHAFGVIQPPRIYPDTDLLRVSFLSLQGQWKSNAVECFTNVQNEIYTKEVELQLVDGASAEPGGHVLPDPLFMDSKYDDRLTTDVNKLAKDGDERTGACADGQSRLLLRVASAEPGTATIAIGSDDPTDGEICPPGGQFGTGGLTVEVRDKVDGLYYGFAVYRAPDNYVRTQHYASDRAFGKRYFDLEVGCNLDIDPFPFDLSERVWIHRPPAVFSHGFWSSPEGWGGAFAPLVNEGKTPFSGGKKIHEVEIVDYHLTATHSFDANAKFVSVHVKKALETMRAKKVACSQVDWVGYSLGGVLPRYEYRRSRYAASWYPWDRADNYQAGNIHKMILLNSPQWGSPIANLIVGIKDPAVLGLLSRLIDLNGSVVDLQEGSRAFRFIGQTPFRTHALVGTGSEVLVDDVLAVVNLLTNLPKHPLLNQLISLAFDFVDSEVRLFYRFQKHDLVVLRPSQIAGLDTLGPYFTENRDTGLDAIHTNATKWSEAYADVVDMLDADMSQFSPYIPAPNLDPKGTGNLVPSDPEYTPVLDGVDVVWVNGGPFVTPDQQITVEVRGKNGFQPVRTQVYGAAPIENVYTSTTAPFRSTITVPLEAIGQIELFATGLDANNGRAISAALTVPVQLGATVTQLTTAYATIELHEPMEIHQLHVTASCSDNVERNVTLATSGTTYVSSKPATIFVDSDGGVHAFDTGSADITISNNGKDLIVPVTVDYGAVRSYGVPTKGNAALWPRISAADEIPTIGNSNFKIRVDDVLPGSAGVLYLSIRPDQEDVGGLMVLVDMPLATPYNLLASSTGSAELAMPIPNEKYLVGIKSYFQAMFDDPEGPLGVCATNGLVVKIQK